MADRVVTGWEEHLLADGSTQVSVREFKVEELRAETERAWATEWIAALAPTVITAPQSIGVHHAASTHAATAIARPPRARAAIGCL